LDRIRINNMQFWGYNGVLFEEQKLGQPLAIDLEMRLDLTLAAHSDSLSDTVNYAEVFAVFKKIIEKENYKLIETLAKRLLDEVNIRWGAKLTSILIKIRKLYVPMEGIFDNIEIEMERIC